MVLDPLMIRVDGRRYVLDRYVNCFTGKVTKAWFLVGKSLPHSLYPSYFVPAEFLQNGEQKTPKIPLNTIIKAPQL